MYGINVLCYVLIRAQYCQLLHNIIDIMIQQSYCCIIHAYITINASQLWNVRYVRTVSVSHTVCSNYWKLHAWIHEKNINKRHDVSMEYSGEIELQCKIVSDSTVLVSSVQRNCSSLNSPCVVALSFCPLAFGGDRPADSDRLLL